MEFRYILYAFLYSYVLSIETDKTTEVVAANNLVPENPDITNKSDLTEKNEESPAESDLFEKINHVVDEFNNYRDNFLLGNKKEDSFGD